MEKQHSLNEAEYKALVHILRERFVQNRHRHERVSWEQFEERLSQKPNCAYSILQMENTGGEPDVIGYDEVKDLYIICDCSKESPLGRRNLCYDTAALDARKENKPIDSVIHMAEMMGVEVLDEAWYRQLQMIEVFDEKTSSWIKTPESVRKKGGAVFCDYRYGQVFMYHNGASSYYSSRGFRSYVRL